MTTKYLSFGTGDLNGTVVAELELMTDVSFAGSPAPQEGDVLTLDSGGTWVHGAPDIVVTDHTLLTNIGNNTHVQIDSHISNGNIHFTESSIDHTNILNIGTNTHAQIDTHIANDTIHFNVASIDHGSIAGLGDNDHPQYALLDCTNQPFTSSVQAQLFRLDLNGDVNSRIEWTDGYGGGISSMIYRQVGDGSLHFGTNIEVSENYFLLAASGLITSGVVNYETLVVSNGDIPNKKYVDDAVTAGGVTDHGALTGLADDDHTQYALKSEMASDTGNITLNAGYF